MPASVIHHSVQSTAFVSLLILDQQLIHVSFAVITFVRFLDHLLELTITPLLAHMMQTDIHVSFLLNADGNIG